MNKTINRVEIVGYVGSTPEYRKSSSGQDVAEFIVGTEDCFFGNNKKQWHRVIIVSASLIKVTKDLISKGSDVRVIGSLNMYKQKRNYSANNITEIIVSEVGVLELIADSTPVSITAPAAYRD